MRYGVEALDYTAMALIVPDMFCVAPGGIVSDDTTPKDLCGTIAHMFTDLPCAYEAVEDALCDSGSYPLSAILSYDEEIQNIVDRRVAGQLAKRTHQDKPGKMVVYMDKEWRAPRIDPEASEIGRGRVTTVGEYIFPPPPRAIH